MCIGASNLVPLFSRVVLSVLIIAIIGCGGGGGTAEVTSSLTPTPAPSPAPTPSGLDNWHLRASGTNADLYGVTYGNGIFVAVGEDGTILSSTDGVLWTKRNSGIADYYTFTAVTYGNGIFLADYDYGILTSPDGMSWTQRSLGLPVDIDTFQLSGMAYGNGIYLALVQGWSLCRPFRGCDGYAVFARTSPDGATWSSPSSATVNPLNLQGLTYGNGMFLGFYGQSILTSPDGAAWTDANWDAPVSLDGAVTYGNGTFIGPGTNDTILTSTNGLEWNVWNTGIISSISRITYGNGTFVAVGSDGVIIQSDPVM